MPKVIKLESIVEVVLPHSHSTKQIEGRLNIRFCPTCGKKLVAESPIVEYACSGCQHLITEGENYCSFCGGLLDWASPSLEHYYMGKVLSNEKFKRLVKEP